MKKYSAPWQVNINKSGGVNSITIRSKLNAAGVSRQIAEVNPYVNPFTEGYSAEDVAKLIAAAPEMLEALQNLVNRCKREGFGVGYDSDILAAEKLIYKATGE